MGERIVVINPNSTQACTDGMSAALEPLRLAGGPALDCLTLSESPPGIECQRDVDNVVAPLCRTIAREDNRADAFVIGCFSDPGLHSAREITRKPVFGISESAILTALSLGERFGIIAILPTSVSRHKRYIRQLGIGARFANDRPIGVKVQDLSKPEIVGDRMRDTARRLIEQDEADVIILGCAGMAHYRAPLERELGVPVVDPTQAATAHAIGAVRLGYRAAVQYRA